LGRLGPLIRRKEEETWWDHLSSPPFARAKVKERERDIFFQITFKVKDK